MRVGKGLPPGAFALRPLPNLLLSCWCFCSIRDELSSLSSLCAPVRVGDWEGQKRPEGRAETGWHFHAEVGRDRRKMLVEALWLSGEDKWWSQHPLRPSPLHACSEEITPLCWRKKGTPATGHLLTFPHNAHLTLPSEPVACAKANEGALSVWVVGWTSFGQQHPSSVRHSAQQSVTWHSLRRGA